MRPAGDLAPDPLGEAVDAISLMALVIYWQSELLRAVGDAVVAQLRELGRLGAQEGAER